MDYIFVLIGLGLILIFLWILIGRKHFISLNKALTEQWLLLEDQINIRHDLIPNLIETARMFGQSRENLFQELIRKREIAMRISDPSAEKIVCEYDLAQKINEVLNLEKEIEILGKDTNFLELKGEFKDVSLELEAKNNRYNEIVRTHNRQRKNFLLLPISLIFGFKERNIFEMEI